MNDLFTNFMQFGFITESVGEWNWQQCCDFAIKCYNLFLMFFYFNIIKFTVIQVQHIVRRMKKFTNRGF